MKKGDLRAVMACVLLLIICVWDAKQARTAVSSVETVVSLATEVDEALRARQRQEAAALLSPDYPQPTARISENLVTLMQINEESSLCYREVWAMLPEDMHPEQVCMDNLTKGHADRYECLVRQDATGEVSLLLVTEGQLFVRYLGDEALGIIVSEGVLVMDRATLESLRLEASPALVPSDFVDPGYLQGLVSRRGAEDIYLRGDGSGPLHPLLHHGRGLEHAGYSGQQDQRGGAVVFAG